MIGYILKSLRKNKGLTLAELAELLNQRYPGTVKFNKSKLSKWENEKEEPRLQSIKLIADYFNVTVDYIVNGIDELSELNEIYVELDKGNKVKVIDFAKELHQKQNRKPKQMTVLYIDGYVSAGSGFFQDDHLDAEISIPTEEVPDKYDLVAKVIGESMAPKINDGDLVFIKHAPEVENGALGVFQVNGENYIKQLKKDPQGPYLKSLNRNYDDVMLSEADDIRTLGEVVDIYKER